MLTPLTLVEAISTGGETKFLNYQQDGNILVLFMSMQTAQEKDHAVKLLIFGRISGKYHISARTMGNRTQAFQDDEQAKYRNDAETLLDCVKNPDNPNYEPNNL